MNWNKLTLEQQLEAIKEESAHHPVVIFKHSTKCSISKMALDRLERAWNEQEMAGVKPYYLDLLAYRNISNRIAETFGIQHESPQVIVVSKEKPVLDLSHYDIEYRQIAGLIKNQSAQPV